MRQDLQAVLSVVASKCTNLKGLCCDTSEGITTLPKVMVKSRQYACMIHAGKRARIRHQRIGPSMANCFGYRHTHAQESILATLVPCGLEPVVLSKSKATDLMQGGVEALMGHGVEDVGGRAVWEHGEVIPPSWQFGSGTV